MRKHLAWLFWAVLTLGVMAAVAKFTWAVTMPRPTITHSVVERHAAATTLKVVTKEGHGSGVHIGNGYVLTAAHVVKKDKSVTLKAKDGSERQANVLWANEDYDVALLRAADMALPDAALECRNVQPGENIVSYGSPISLEFVGAYGRVSGEARSFGPWKSVLVTDSTTIMGMSGGPVFDSEGKLIGITVGAMLAPIGLSASIAGYGFVVPARAVCDLLARA